MPHRCLSCSRIYADDAPEVFSGCAGCGGTAFLYLRNGAPEVAPGVTSPCDGEYAVDVERLLLPDKGPTRSPETPTIVSGTDEGSYEIDLTRAFEERD